MTKVFAGFFWLLVATSGVRPGFAQDVSLMPLQWSDFRDPPDELPVVKSKLLMEFPRDLRGTPDIGYVIYEAIIDSKGQILMLHPHPTLDAFVTAETQSRHQWKFAPGKRDGKAVNTAITFAVIYNPVSAAPEKPDATPRLLEVGAVEVARPKTAKKDEVFPDRIAGVELRVDQKGAVSAVVNAPDELRDRVAVAVKNWRFAPARQGGQPVEATVRLPIMVLTKEPEKKQTTPPRVVFQSRPHYPFAMRYSEMRGEVVVDFLVDIEGRVRNAYVIRSLNPAFDEPALEAVRKWRFEPGRSGDQPINTHMQVPIVFTLDQLPGGGGDGMRSPKKPDLSKLPEQFRYDTEPKLRGSVRPVFPHAALTANREGSAVVQYVVSPAGVVIEAMVKTATSPEFGRALLAAVEQFVYEPALKGGRPSPALLAFSQEFKKDERFQLISDTELGLMIREQKRPQSIVSLSELDRKLTPLSQRPPKFPLVHLGTVAKGTAMIEFLVDDEGRARLPRIISASDEAFGYAAIQGVAAWRFEPPTRGGRATVARVQVPVDFLTPADPAKR